MNDFEFEWICFLLTLTTCKLYKAKCKLTDASSYIKAVLKAYTLNYESTGNNRRTKILFLICKFAYNTKRSTSLCWVVKILQHIRRILANKSINMLNTSQCLSYLMSSKFIAPTSAFKFQRESASSSSHSILQLPVAVA